jgi:hypothetical protein
MYATLEHATHRARQDTFEDALLHEIVDSLRSTGYPELRNLVVDVDGHDVCLHGQVSSYFLRQKAECIILSNPAVATFHSLVQVT